MFKTRVNENAPASNGDAQPATATLQAAMTAGQKTQWLMLCRPQGVVEVRYISRDILPLSCFLVDLDPPQIDFGILDHCNCIPSEPPD
jgi:cleavage and polyadenylation specificity factor subunit 1